MLSAGCGAGLGVGFQVARLRTTSPERTAFQARNEERTGRAPIKAWLPLDRIDVDVKHAVLVSEDYRFFDHSGFDLHEVKVAIRDAIEDGERPRGASTLTQQLAKNLYLSGDRTLSRKLVEAVMTLFLEGLLTKARILELYLNEVEFGPHVYGVQAAARHHFGTSAGHLTQTQAAELAALLPAPHRDRPGSDREAYLARVDRILERMKRTRGFRERIP